MTFLSPSPRLAYGTNALAVGQNLNNLHTQGVYDGAGLINAPDSAAYFVTVLAPSAKVRPDGVHQTVVKIVDGTVRTRVFVSGAWTAWADPATTAAASAIAAAPVVTVKTGDVDPAVTDDVDHDVATVPQMWLNTVSKDVFICVDNTAGAAVWNKITFAA